MKMSDKEGDVVKVCFILQNTFVWVRIFVAQGKYKLSKKPLHPVKRK